MRAGITEALAGRDMMITEALAGIGMMITEDLAGIDIDDYGGYYDFHEGLSAGLIGKGFKSVPVEYYQIIGIQGR